MKDVPRIVIESYFSDQRYNGRVTMENRVYLPQIHTVARASLPAEPGLLTSDDDATLYWDGYDFQELKRDQSQRRR